MSVPAIVAGFREGLERGELLIQHCNSCGKVNMYPAMPAHFANQTILAGSRQRGRAR